MKKVKMTLRTILVVIFIGFILGGIIVVFFLLIDIQQASFVGGLRDTLRDRTTCISRDVNLDGKIIAGRDKLKQSLRDLFDTAPVNEAVPVIIMYSGEPLQSCLDDLKERMVKTRIFGRLIERISFERRFHLINAISASLTRRMLIDILLRDNAILQVELDQEVQEFMSRSVPHIGVDKVKEEFSVIGRGVKVAVVDTGVASDNEALRGKVVSSVNFTGNADAEDKRGHGTHTACIIACDSDDYKGVAPGSGIYNIKVINNDGHGRASITIAGIESAVDQNVDVINVSIGAAIDVCNGRDALSAAADAAVEAGSIVVAAAGNSGPTRHTLATPGCARKAITVGASDYNNAIASFSSRGPTDASYNKPDIYAPGFRITALTYEGKVKMMSGTSQAAPHVTGVVALLKEINRGLSRDAILDILVKTQDPLRMSGDGYIEEGRGVVNAYMAVSEIKSDIDITTEKDRRDSSDEELRNLEGDGVEAVKGEETKEIEKPEESETSSDREEVEIPSRREALEEFLENIAKEEEKKEEIEKPTEEKTEEIKIEGEGEEEEKEVEDKEVEEKEVEDKEVEDKEVEDKEVEDKEVEDKEVEEEEVREEEVGEEEVEEKVEEEEVAVKEKEVVEEAKVESKEEKEKKREEKIKEKEKEEEKGLKYTEARTDFASCIKKSGSDQTRREVCSSRLLEEQWWIQFEHMDRDDQLYLALFINEAMEIEEMVDDLDSLSADKQLELIRVLRDIENYMFIAGEIEELYEEVLELKSNLDKMSKAQIGSKISSLESTVNEAKKRSLDFKFINGMVPFKDVDDNEWYFAYVADLKRLGCVGGYKDVEGNELGIYQPGNSVTVAEGLKIVLECASYNEEDTASTTRVLGAFGHWAENYFNKGEELGISIVSDPYENPDRPLTRSEIVILLLEAFGVTPFQDVEYFFTDLDAEAEETIWIETARELGIISGDAHSPTFRPADSVNRAEMAKIVLTGLDVFE